MNYCQIIKADCANGTGIRLSLFVSGCTNCCPGCFQKETWDFNYGFKYTEEVEEYIINELKKEYYTGLTILGGEPFEISNQQGIVSLVKRVKNELHKTVWIYTGFNYEDLLPCGKRHFDVTDEILNSVDVIVDGKFIEDLKDISLKFKGSSNQRIIDVKKTITSGEVVLLDL